MEDIYLIHTLEFYKVKEEIYKISTNYDIDKRVRQYIKGSQILCLTSCENSIQCDKELIVLFKNILSKQKNKIG